MKTYVDIVINLILTINYRKIMRGRADKTSATNNQNGKCDSSSTAGRAKPKTIKIGIHSFLL